MEDKDFNDKINKLEKLYNTNGHQMVLNNMHKSIIKLNKIKNGNVKKKREIIKPTKDEKYDLVVLIILIIVGILNLIWNDFKSDTYFAGLVWFFLSYACLFKAEKKYFAMLYLFTLVGMGLMVGPRIINIFKSPVMSDNGGNGALTTIYICAILFIIACVASRIYCTNEKFKSYKYSILIIFLLYMIPFLVIEFLPFIFNL